MDDQLKKPGAISWFELMTKDVPEVRSHYGKLLGRTLEDMSMAPEMSYKPAADLGGKVLVPPGAARRLRCKGIVRNRRAAGDALRVC